ncbi:hypothetical protein BT69DRAFT_1238275 [Atractiella rhizophila]|nr:hypothetical protein BT69DRAFT_1238275 [Atractiella rhizophila]
MTGIFTKGCDNADATSHITYCYGLYLSQDPTIMLDPGSKEGSPRQRNEFLYAYQADGDTRTYQWTNWISSETGWSQHFFHLFQANNGPTITLDLINGYIQIIDNIRCGGGCSTRIPASSFTNKAIRHQIVVTYGSNGSFSYIAKEKVGGKVLMRYNASGYMGSDRQTIKTGMYRLVQSSQTLARGYWGDFVLI